MHTGNVFCSHMDRVKQIWCLSPMRAAKVQASLRIRTVSPEPPLLTHTSSESRGTFRQKARSLVPLNGRACTVKICHDRKLEDTNSLDGAHIFVAERHSDSCRIVSRNDMESEITDPFQGIFYHLMPSKDNTTIMFYNKPLYNNLLAVLSKQFKFLSEGTQDIHCQNACT